MLKKLLSSLSPVRIAYAAEPALAPETRAVLDQFLPMCAIPHQSGHEEALSRYLENWAIKHGFAVIRDKANNVIIDKPASAGHEKAPRVLLQAHMDMVCVAEEGIDFNPQRDPILTVIEGNTLKAKGTSLGADNGVGAAMALCILLDKSMEHGPLRVILTTDEEAGMTGASALDPCHVDGDYLINIDGEDFDVVCNSCAGCAHMEFERPVSWEKPHGDTAFRVALSGLQGGHSGIAIHEGRASAIREIAYLLAAAQSAGLHIELAAITGGIAGNAIPNSAEATIVLPERQVEAFKALMDQQRKAFAKAYAVVEPNAAFSLESVPCPAKVLEAQHLRAAIRFITVAPNGVRSMSATTANHTESSSSMGILRLTQNILEIHLLARSSAPLHMNHFMLMGEGLAELCGFTRRPCTPTPGWAENPTSRLLPLMQETFTEVTGQPMRVCPTHGGLECGWFECKNPKLDIVAIGPHMVNPHSPEETLYLDSIPGIYKTIAKLIEKLGKC